MSIQRGEVSTMSIEDAIKTICEMWRVSSCGGDAEAVPAQFSIKIVHHEHGFELFLLRGSKMISETAIHPTLQDALGELADDSLSKHDRIEEAMRRVRVIAGIKSARRR